MNVRNIPAVRKAQAGFTLIELMIVVAIIGILAAVAIPSYQDYANRAKVTEAVNALAAAKVSVSEFYTSQGAMPADETQAGISTGATGTYVAGVTYTKGADANNSSLEVTLSAVASGLPADLADKKFKLAAVGSTSGVKWTCSTTTAPIKYLPANCRTPAPANPPAGQ